MKAAVIAFSEKGISTSAAIAAALEGDGCQCSFERCASGGLAEWTEQNFNSCDALIFVSSVGIAVRAVSTYIQSKLTDPAVIVVDECANWVIPVLSGHIGGANKLAERLAAMMGATAVITTATDINCLFAVDVWAKKNGFVIANPQKIKTVSSKLLAGKKIRLKSDFPVDIDAELVSQIETVDNDFDVVVSIKRQSGDALWLIPERLVLGVGCRKNTKAKNIASAFNALCSRADIDERALWRVASIDVKADEQGLIDFCHDCSVTPMFFSAQQLNEIKGDFSHSDFVFDTVGVDNVCERAAMAAGGDLLIEKKLAIDGVTVAAAVQNERITITLD